MEKTLLIIKPDAVADNVIGQILSIVEEKGFRIVSMKMMNIDKKQAESFYEVHRGKPFYESLVEFMSSGPIVPTVLSHENAVSYLREVVGATDPVKAVEGTIRKRFARNIQQNSVHASDSPENAVREISFFFKDREIF